MIEPVVIGDATLYLGDCREILPTLGKVDAMVTDPPYGIGFQYASHDDATDKWFALMDDVIPLLKKSADFIVLPCCGVGRLKWWYARHDPEWLIIWYKGSPGHLSSVGFNDHEPYLAWGRPSVPMHDHFSTACGFDPSIDHPCPKPFAYADWLVTRSASAGSTICDPFMGSGTTGVACAKRGRKFIGIEIDPKYFDIACNRIDEAYKQPDFFIEKPKPPKQEAML